MVYPGGKNHLKIRIARNKNKFSGPVEVTATALPPEGVTIVPVTLAADQEEAEVEVAVQKTVPPGKLRIHLKAHGAADAQASDQVELAVVPSPPFLGLSVTPKVEVYQGGKAQFQVKLGRTAANGPVTLQFEDLPPGIALPNQEIPANQDELAIVLRADRTGNLPPDTESKTFPITIHASTKVKIGPDSAEPAPLPTGIEESAAAQGRCPVRAGLDQQHAVRH